MGGRLGGARWWMGLKGFEGQQPYISWPIPCCLPYSAYAHSLAPLALLSGPTPHRLAVRSCIRSQNIFISSVTV